MSVSTESPEAVERAAGGADVPTVDPRAPRFGQSLTALGFATGIALDLPVVVYAVAAVLLLAVVSGWRVDVYGVLWQHGVSHLLTPPTEREAAAPHRFARLLGAAGGTVASLCLLAGVPLAGYAVAWVVAALAALAALTGICIGCRMYRQVAFVRDLGIL
jgi:hypothetical protein